MILFRCFYARASGPTVSDGLRYQQDAPCVIEGRQNKAVDTFAVKLKSAFHHSIFVHQKGCQVVRFPSN